MKIKFFLCLMSVLLVLVLAACTSPAPASTVTLKFAHHTTPTSAYAAASEWFLNEIEQRSNGQVKFERYFSASLAPSKEVLEAINSGLADAGLVSGFYSPGKTPLLAFGKSACLFKHQYEGLMAFQDMFEEVPAMMEELDAYNCLPMTTTGTSSMGLITKKQISSLADIQGLKIRTGGPQAEIVKELGGVPVNLAGPEIFEALDKGTIDGVVYNPAAILAYGVQDAGKYYYNLPFGGSLSILGINAQSWNKLPKDVQKIIKEVAKEHPAAHQQIYEIEGDGVGFEVFKEKGIAVIEPSASDLNKVLALAAQGWDKWAAEMEGQGLPGRDVVDTFMKLVEKYEPKNPDF
ncbi:C4-dicarboxylate TRAP transporter substrate-binding protein [Chloroflexota bacterium]